LAPDCIISIAAVSCDDDDNNVVVDNTITGKATATANLSILVQALVKADLATFKRSPYTVFAPTNEASLLLFSYNPQ
jgi:uncharacterized surface protein with fasciclin (FAS1) repeats